MTPRILFMGAPLSVRGSNNSNLSGMNLFLAALISFFICIAQWAAPSYQAFSYAEELEPVIVSATRSDQRPEEVAANVTVITRGEIESLPVHTIGEALNHLPGLFVFTAGGLGSQATPTIHGSLERQVAVYLDGVPLNMMANPIADLGFLPLNNVERIEIYKGGASSAWGSALGGVINIISRNPVPGKPHGSMDSSAGQNSTLDSNLFLNGSISRLGYLLSTGHVETNGPIGHAEHDREHVYTKISHPLAPLADLTFTINYINGRTQNPLPTEPAFYDESRHRRFFQTLTLRSSFASFVHLELGVRHQRFENRQNRTFIDLEDRVNRFELVERLWGATFKSAWELGRGNTLVVGADGDWGSSDFSVLEQRDIGTRNLAAYLNDTLTLGPFTATAGLRVDDNKDFGSEVSPSAGIVYRMNQGKTKIRFQVSRAFSAPPLNFLYYPEIGNPDLKSETGMDYQIGVEARLNRLIMVEIDLFLAKIKDMIRYDPERNLLINVDEVLRKGAEGSLSINAPYGFGASIGAAYVEVEDDRTGEEIKDVPGLTWDIVFTHEYRDMVSQTLTGKYIWYNSSMEETRDKNFLFDYLIRVKIPATPPKISFSLFGAVHNIFNTTQFLLRDFPAPSRWLEAGIRFAF
jgi:vitamin B12 transporter